MGLPTEYTNWYEVWVLEDEIEATIDWDELEKPPHHLIECTPNASVTQWRRWGLWMLVKRRKLMGKQLVVLMVLDGTWDGEQQHNNSSIVSSFKMIELTASAA